MESTLLRFVVGDFFISNAYTKRFFQKCHQPENAKRVDYSSLSIKDSLSENELTPLCACKGPAE